MPSRALKPCARPGCPGLTSKRSCAKCGSYGDRNRENAYRRGYDRRWQRVRLAFLQTSPLCCDPYGVHGDMPELASEVDHVIPHKGNAKMFWDDANWQALCKSCHSRKTMGECGGGEGKSNPCNA
jgi:5-methylcytosine-specific restriction enzyme A